MIGLLGFHPGTLAAEDAAPDSEPTADSISFVVWGHPYAGTGEPPLHYQDVIDTLRRLRPDLLFITGDAVQGMYSQEPDPALIREDWETLYGGLDDLGIPVHAAPGNHDVHNYVTRDIFLERHPRPPYSFDFGGSRFLILDTIGMDLRTEDGQHNWHPQMLPFSDAQIGFIADTTARPSEYEHLFVFLHHTEFLLDEGSFWWEKVHPMLAAAKARMVFAGNPVHSKYLSFERDRVQYVQNSFTEPRPVEFYQRERSRWALAKAQQFDTLVQVTVSGHAIVWQPVIVGARTSATFHPEWFRAVENPDRWTIRLANEFHERFGDLRDLLLLAAAYGGALFLLGMGLGLLVRHRRTSGQR